MIIIIVNLASSIDERSSIDVEVDIQVAIVVVPRSPKSVSRHKMTYFRRPILKAAYMTYDLLIVYSSILYFTTF